jgi:hypothetical protein
MPLWYWLVFALAIAIAVAGAFLYRQADRDARRDAEYRRWLEGR